MAQGLRKARVSSSGWNINGTFLVCVIIVPHVPYTILCIPMPPQEAEEGRMSASEAAAAKDGDIIQMERRMKMLRWVAQCLICITVLQLLHASMRHLHHSIPCPRAHALIGRCTLLP